MAGNKRLKSRLGVDANSSLRLRQKTMIIRYAVAGALAFTLIGIIIFLYLNLASSKDAIAGDQNCEMPIISQKAPKNFLLVDLSHLSPEEMGLLVNRDFKRDTTRKEYTSVKWNLNNSMSHLTLEVSNTKHDFSLELFNLSGIRVLYFANLTDEKVFVDKLELIPNQEYSYLVKNSVGEIYAGILRY